MRELNISGKMVRVRATPLALLYYKQEFKTDLLGDLLKMQAIANDPSQLDTIAILQMVWAMAKADAYGQQFSSFIEWISSFEDIDFSDSTFLVAVMEEATDGFFRKGKYKNKQ